jgi:hypothetical protein
VKRIFDDASSADLNTTSTSLRTRGEFGPGRHQAVDWALVSTAALGVFEGRADVATMLGGTLNGTDTLADTAATSLGALAPGSPSGDLAVNGARTRVASLGFHGTAANGSAVGSLSYYTAEFRRSTYTARLGALAVDGPTTHCAVCRAVL